MITVSGYRTSDEISVSSRSVVFRGQRIQDGLPVIVKVLRGDYPTVREVVRYKQEYQITLGLQHLAGVVTVYELMAYGNSLAMVLEDFGGTSLDRLITARPLSLREFLHTAIPMVRSLGEIHSAHVIHKDVNPSNVVYNSHTGQLKFIDFGISTDLSHESPATLSPALLEGTLSYISPEQTGRMNRSVDYRTDYYSLGATFFEMLTTRKLFETSDALEAVHHHIAVAPEPPHRVDAGVPEMLSAIILKLLAKNPEERYQSTAGIGADLEECIRQLDETKRIVSFPIAARDVPERFEIPEKLYGRAYEIAELGKAFEEACEGHKRIVLVTGQPGIGKTSLVRELQNPAAARRALFATGKFDHSNRYVPYRAVENAFRGLISNLIAEEGPHIHAWAEKIMGALGSGARLLIDMIPELELLIGPQPELPHIDPVASENRLNHLFTQFVRVFCSREHPLVLFLDDLQWADAASVRLLKLIVEDEETHHLLGICAFRENEAGRPQGAAANALKIIDVGSGDVRWITVGPLNLAQVKALVADALRSDRADSESLAGLVFHKAGGNPFFTTEFLKSAYEENLLELDPHRGAWRWKQASAGQALTEDVAELVVGKIRRMDDQCREILTLAAFLGSHFDLDTLAVICGRSKRETLEALRPALKEGLVIPLGEGWKHVQLDVDSSDGAVTADFKFFHDRIQTAAYSLVPEDRRPILHRLMAQALLKRVEEDKSELRIFDIASHLNQAHHLLEHPAERQQSAELNLQAGKKAKASAAYDQALRYFEHGLSSLESDCWTTQYDLALELHVEAAEAAYLCTDFDRMEELTSAVLDNTNVTLHAVRAHEIRIQAFIARNEMLAAVDTALYVLRLLDIRLPRRPTKVHLLAGLVRARLLMTGRNIESLLDLPPMKNPRVLAATRIINSVAKAAYVSAPLLVPLLSFKALALSVEYGNAPESAFFFATYGLVLFSGVGDIERGYRFGMMALKLADRFDAPKLNVRTRMVVDFFIRPWKEHYRNVADSFEGLYRQALESGNPEDAALSAYMWCTGSFRLGNDLRTLNQEMTAFSDSIRRLKQESALGLLTPYHQAVRNLMGEVDDPCKLKGDIFNEFDSLPVHMESGDDSAVCVTYLNKLFVCYVFGDYAMARQCADLTRRYLHGVRGSPAVPVFYLYDSLSQLSQYESATRKEQKHIARRVASNQRMMKKWAVHGPMNFDHKCYLVEAERNRIRGRDSEAIVCFNRAIEEARENHYMNEEALAYERAALFYLDRGRVTVAAAHMLDACYCYERWGALAKVRQLRRQYPHLTGPSGSKAGSLAAFTAPHPSTTPGPTSNTGEALDLASIMMASRVISGEIVLNRLLVQLLKIVMDNAGAQRGALIMEANGAISVEASGSAGQPDDFNVRSVPLESSEDVPQTLIERVFRTRESLLLDDATAEHHLMDEAYLNRHNPKSVLCIPLVYHGEISALLYLENNLASGSFTAERLEILSLLASQAAVSLENARLYDLLDRRVEERTSELEATNQELKAKMLERERAQSALNDARIAADQANRAKSEFLAAMSHELRTPLNAIIGFSELTESQYFGELNDDQALYVRHICAAGKHLLQLINDVLDLAKIDAGKLELHLSAVPIAVLLEYSLSLIRDQAIKQGLKLNLRLLDNLETLVIQADETKIKQIMLNLLSNSVKFTPKGGSVMVRAGRHEKGILISVTDTGVGIAPGDTERVFRAFEHAISCPSGKQQGTGIGLALTRRLVEKQGGRIWAESEGVGKGSTFSFFIPEVITQTTLPNRIESQTLLT